jgi:hypothetical protein
MDLHVNPSDKTIRLGPLAVPFLLTWDNSNGRIAVFELIVPGARRVAVSAHSHDHSEETIYGVEGVLTWSTENKSMLVPGRRYAFRAAPFTGSTTTAAGT